MDEKNDKLSQVKEALSKIQELDVESLSNEDLEAVAGGFCSVWCCSAISPQETFE